MTNFSREMNTYLFIFRWILLIIGFLTYSTFESNEYGWIIVLIAANFIYTLSIFFNNSKKITVFLITFDLIYNLVFLFVTEQGMNPVILYSLTTLIWLKTITDNKYSILTMIGYFLAVSFTFFLTQQDGYNFWSNQVEFTIYFFFFMWFILFMKYFSWLIKENHRILYSIFQFIRSLTHEQSFSTVQVKAEKLMVNIFKADDAFICWTNQKGTHKDWERHYINRLYMEKQLFLLKKPIYIELQSFTGKMTDFFYFPIHNEKQINGGILLALPNKGRIKRYQYTYLYILTVFLSLYLSKADLRNEVSASLKETVRKKMAQDMHDGLAQQLFFLSAQIFHLKNNMPENINPDLRNVIINMEDQLKSSHLEVRNFIRDLRDEHNQSSNLAEAIQQLINRTINETSIQVYYENTGNLTSESIEFEKSIYRVMEEAINNVKKHAKASKLYISINVTSVQWTIKIEDNGIGFNQDSNKKGSYGLRGIRERVEQFGGNLYLKTEPFKGTEIIAVIPSERGQAYA
jgi:signal transduction histidine kinase